MRHFFSHRHVQGLGVFSPAAHYCGGVGARTKATDFPIQSAAQTPSVFEMPVCGVAVGFGGRCETVRCSVHRLWTWNKNGVPSLSSSGVEEASVPYTLGTKVQSTLYSSATKVSVPNV
jgi:hypothetical protein